MRECFSGIACVAGHVGASHVIAVYSTSGHLG